MRFTSTLHQFIFMIIVSAMLGCSSESGTTSVATGVSAISLQTSQTSIKSDNIESATITITVLDSNNGVMSGISIGIVSTGGQLSASSGTTDSSGQITVVVTSGTLDPSNQTITITASSGSVAQSIPIVIYGSTVALSSDESSLVVGGSPATATLTADVQNAASNPLNSISTTLAITSGNATFPGAATTYTTTTDAAGQISRVITATAAGTITITATALGTTYTLQLTASVPASALTITTPATDPAYQTAGTDQTVTASVPDGSTYRFITSIGTWVSSGTSTTTATTGGGAGSLSETLQNAAGGTSTIVVTDDSDPTKVATTSVVFTSGAAPDSITFQTDKTVLAVSTVTVQDSTTITAYATNSGLPVANTGIIFSLAANGTGAFLNTSYGVTDSTGKAEVTFTSGTTATSGAGINVTATSVAAPAVSDFVNLVVGGTAGSVVIGVGSVIFSMMKRLPTDCPYQYLLQIQMEVL